MVAFAPNTTTKEFSDALVRENRRGLLLRPQTLTQALAETKEAMLARWWPDAEQQTEEREERQ